MPPFINIKAKNRALGNVCPFLDILTLREILQFSKLFMMHFRSVNVFPDSELMLKLARCITYLMFLSVCKC